MSVRKSLGLGLVVGLLAMALAALPAIASAAPSLKGPSGTLVPVGTTITFKGSVIGTQAGTFEGEFSGAYLNAKGEQKEILFDC